MIALKIHATYVGIKPRGGGGTLQEKVWPPYKIKNYYCLHAFSVYFPP